MTTIRSLHAKIILLLSLATVTELKIVNFGLNYLTVLVYSKTIIIHQSGGS